MGTYITAVALLVAGVITMATGQILPGSLCFIAGGLTYVRIAFLAASPEPMSIKSVHDHHEVLTQAEQITQQTAQITKFSR